MEDIMSKIIVTEFVSLDGVAQDPHKWSLPFWNDKTEKFKYDEMAATGAMLLGRKTYEVFAAAWPSRTGNFADRFNRLPKLVASRTLKTVAWSPSKLLAEPIADSVAQVKNSVEGAIYIHGKSGTFTRTVETRVDRRISSSDLPRRPRRRTAAVRRKAESRT